MGRVVFHVDVDSPLRLLQFYGYDIKTYTNYHLDNFYEIVTPRILSFFHDFDVKATFFMVGDDLKRSEKARIFVQEAYKEGHEIANHTFSHPFGLTQLSEEKIIEEIDKCTQQIVKITGEQPIGFRAPGYDISSQIINILESLNYKYDSSGFWSTLNPLIKLFHKISSKESVYSGFGECSSAIPSEPYIPLKENWLKRGKERAFIEYPLPRTRIFNLPYYSNYHLTIPDYIFDSFFKVIERPFLVYLFHIIEFAEMTDKIPNVLKRHPNLQTPFKKKLSRLEFIVKSILNNYQCVLTKHITFKNSIISN